MNSSGSDSVSVFVSSILGFVGPTDYGFVNSNPGFVGSIVVVVVVVVVVVNGVFDYTHLGLLRCLGF